MSNFAFLFACWLSVGSITVFAVSDVNAIPPAILHGMVFFDSDSAELTDMAKSSIRHYVLTIPHFAGPCRQVRVIGHLDRAEGKRGRTGTLDQQRATKVRDALVDEGLTGLSFVVSAAGSDSLLVPQPPDDEPQNRRVELYWGC